MYYGAAWYPEHWSEDRWPVDLKLMREAGLNVVRVAEFAWSRMEPARGKWDFDWLQRAVDLAAEHGIAVVMGTPTATPPAWLTQAFPDVLAVGPNGRPEPHGARCHYNPCSPRYLEMCRDVATQMAQRFGNHPNVIGWQIDNEYWRVSYDDTTRSLFHAWLQRRYGTLESLNRHWTTAYWSQEYSDWAQIPFPTTWSNPCLEHSFFRFMTEVYRTFQRTQMDAIRAHATPRQWITHNCHAHEWLDWVEIGRDLDLVAWDPYLGGEHLDPNRFGFVSDLCRNIKPDRKHWIIETQPGRVSWTKINSDLHRGETRNLVWHFVGHGADAVLFWQWRAPLGGQEQYHGTLLAADGTPRPLFEEVARAGQELARVAPRLASRRPRAEVAVVHTFPDRWSLLKQKHHADFHPVTHLQDYYAALRRQGVTLDVIDPSNADLRRYKLVVAPSLHVLSESVASAFEKYVVEGGHLVLGVRSGFKDEHNAVLPSRQPGLRLGAVLGAQALEYYALTEPVPIAGSLGTGTSGIWAEPMEAIAGDVETLLTFGPGNSWLEGKPAMVTRAYGKGRITYLGVWPNAGMMDSIMAWALGGASVRVPGLRAPSGVSVHELSGDEGMWVLLNNCTDKAQTVGLPQPMRDVLSDKRMPTEAVLEPRGVMVLEAGTN